MHTASAEPVVGPPARLAAAPSVFTESTTLRFEHREAGPVLLRIFDATGREVDRPFEGALRSGPQQLVWDPRARGASVPGGVYFARLDAGGIHESVKLVRIE
jgi:hypothetical protein